VVAAVAAAVVAVAVEDDRAEGDKTMIDINGFRFGRCVCVLLVTVMVPLAGCSAHDPASSADTHAQQQHFKSPEEASAALVAAVKEGSQEHVLAILGPNATDVISSGDPVADHAAGERFTTAADEKTTPVTQDGGAVVLELGSDAWPFPIPLMKDKSGWYFDTDAGRQELINRRVGRNELHTIDVARAYVDAQREYARRMHNVTTRYEYAQKLRSTPGKHDGLYWEAKGSEEESPLGPLVATAQHEGTGENRRAKAPALPRVPLQDPDGAGAARSGGREELHRQRPHDGGFALVAYPAEYGAGGVMTFVVNQVGVIFQKDLGESTEQTVSAMTAVRSGRHLEPRPGYRHYPGRHRCGCGRHRRGPRRYGGCGGLIRGRHGFLPARGRFQPLGRSTSRLPSSLPTPRKIAPSNR
jgi:hypothetical protein